MDLVLNCLSAIVIALLSLFSLYYLFLYRSSKVAHEKEAPSAAGAWPILGHLPLFSGSQTPHRTLGALANKYGPLFTIKLGATRALVLSNWEIAKECFTINDMVVSSRPRLVATQHMAYNGAMFGFAPYGPYWRQLRKISTLEILSNRRVEQLRHVRALEVQTSIKELFNVWSSKKNGDGYVLVELKQWFTQLTFNMVLRMAVGKRYFGATNMVDEQEAQRSIKALKEYMRLMGVFTVADAIPYLRWFDFGGHEKAMKKTAKELDKIVGEWLEEHRQNRALDEKIERDQDFMDVMISMLEGTTIEGFDADPIIKATTLTLILGGTDTSSVTLTWALCLLLRNPLVLERAKEELDIQVGKERCVTESDISKLVYLQAIVKETLRLYPPGPLSGPREFSENCTLSGYNVRKGTRLIVNLWKIQTDPSVWSDPLEFKPERFLTTHKDVDVKGSHFELSPFGYGRRICPGISFALPMVHLTLASFLHSFKILNPSTELVDMTETFGLTNTKASPLEILVKPRFSPNCYEIM
ncbi:Cytochrome P450 [Sesbania bispinosa]|nr:Cytochrome P450 [Sesbania bispinosa]